MNKRSVLYFRGQDSHHNCCLPVLFRNEWTLGNRKFPLNPSNRGAYYAAVRKLQDDVFKVVKKIGAPRNYLLEYLPTAAAAILQHYELWPTHFIDVTRSLPTAISFSEGAGNRTTSVLYAFAMPDLRGSITSDIDQHISLARLEALCPPDAKRPHHQDAFLVARFSEPQGDSRPGDKLWDDWQRKTDLMRRLVAKFRLSLCEGRLPGAPTVTKDFMIPPLNADRFGNLLRGDLLAVIERLATQFSG